MKTPYKYELTSFSESNIFLFDSKGHIGVTTSVCIQKYGKLFVNYPYFSSYLDFRIVANKSTTCGFQRLAVENSKSKKGHNFVKKNCGLPPLLVWVPLLIVSNFFEFQVNVFSNNRYIRKCQSFRTLPLPQTPGL